MGPRKIVEGRGSTGASAGTPLGLQRPAVWKDDPPSPVQTFQEPPKSQFTLLPLSVELAATILMPPLASLYDAST